MQYIPFLSVTLITLLLSITFKSKVRNRILLFFLDCYLIIIWWLIYKPHELFGRDTYLAKYFYFHTAKIIYLPSGLTSSGVFLNVVMTLPAGIFVFLIFKNKINLLKILLFAIFVGLFNESTQFIFDLLLNLRRTVDITDVITNFTGILLGFTVAKYGINLDSSKNNLRLKNYK